VALAPVPQKFSVPGQMHMPPWQGAPAGQVVPQPPQLFASFIVLMQTPPQTEPAHAGGPSPSAAASSASRVASAGPDA
jgi:hypothetical protein